MKVSYKNSIVTINTGILMNTLKAHGGTLKLQDAKGNDVYAVFYDESPMASGKLTDITFPVNGVDAKGYAVLNVPVPIEASLEEVKQRLGSVLVAADKALPQISAIVADFDDHVNALFDSVDTDEISENDCSPCPSQVPNNRD